MSQKGVQKQINIPGQRKIRLRIRRRPNKKYFQSVFAFHFFLSHFLRVEKPPPKRQFKIRIKANGLEKTCLTSIPEVKTHTFLSNHFWREKNIYLRTVQTILTAIQMKILNQFQLGRWIGVVEKLYGNLEIYMFMQEGELYFELWGTKSKKTISIV